jgi:ATP-binding cassette subfamily F protein 3
MLSPGFPRHHRVLHVKQEVRSTGKSVLDAVLQSDVEREALLEEEREIVARSDMRHIREQGDASETGA